MPTPGFSMFTKIIPIVKLIREAEINHNMALPPMRPTVFKSPNFAIPTTKVENTRGAIIICTKSKNILVKILMRSAKTAINSGED